MTLFNRTFALAFSALVTGTLPACDADEYQALGVTVEDLDAMSEEELDELAALEDDTDLAAAPTRHGGGRPDDLADSEHPHRPGTVDTLWNGPFAIPADAQRPGTVDTLWNGPFHTHTAHALPGTLGVPHKHTRPGAVEDMTTPTPPPTHAGLPVVGELGLPDEGCDTHGDDPDFANG